LRVDLQRGCRRSARAERSVSGADELTAAARAQLAPLLDSLWSGLLPLWAERGVDRVHGGFHNRLDHALAPVPDGFKRLVVQARQIYSFAWAARESGNARWLELARDGFTFLRTRYLDRTHGGWFFTLMAAGEPLDRSKDAYAHAFALLALAELARASGEREPLALAAETSALLERELADPERGGFRERAAPDWSEHAEPLPRRQNPHMHLFEAFLALEHASGDAAYAARAHALSELLCSRWIDPTSGCLREFFDRDWRFDPAVAQGTVEPGHHFEWFWLLHRSAALRAHPALRSAAAGLWSFASGCGIDPRDGAVFDGVSSAGELLAPSKRLWPQTEYLKALGARLEWHACAEAARRLPHALALCRTRYLDSGSGGWFEHASREGAISSAHMNATSVYHVITALLDLSRVLGMRAANASPRSRTPDAPERELPEPDR
jgi:mannose/cellobiose epimerase-like protein (N-acyl-D-glucosamine 2-epimerase family)